MTSSRPKGRFQPLARPTAKRDRPHQARWADAMKVAMENRRIGPSVLTELVADRLGLPAGSDKLRRWLSNDTAIDAHVIPVLAEAVDAHPLEMLAEYGLVEDTMVALALRLREAEQRMRQQQALLAQRHRLSGGALFVDTALRAGTWQATAVPHWRGRRCRYHFADYVLLEHCERPASRAEADRVFADDMARSGAEWDDSPFDGEPDPGPRGHRVFVPRLPAMHPPQHWATDLGPVRGIVIAGPKWTGLYAVAALVSQALGWGRDSFEFLARMLNPQAASVTAATSELLRGWLANPAESPRRVFAHILTPGGPDETDIRLLAAAPTEIEVVLLLPDEGRPSPDGPSGLDIVAALSEAESATVRAQVTHWRTALAERPRLTHLVVPPPEGHDGRPVSRERPGFLDGYFDACVEVALRVLALLAAQRPVASLVPEPARTDAFATLAAGRQPSPAKGR